MKITFEELPNAIMQLIKKVECIEQIIIKKDSPPQHEIDELLSVPQTAEFLRLTIPTIYSKVSKGELPCMKRSNRIYFSRIELMEYLKAGRKKTVDEIEAEAEKYIQSKKKGGKS